MSRTLFVRHAPAVFSPDEPASRWPLTAAGVDAATALGVRLATLPSAVGATVRASDETKAIQTAELLQLGAVQVDARLGEVARPWYESAADHRGATVRYLRGEAVDGWEPSAAALDRFEDALETGTDELLVVAAHGTIISLWTGARFPSIDPADFWLGLDMPDAHLVDHDTATITRVAV